MSYKSIGVLIPLWFDDALEPSAAAVTDICNLVVKQLEFKDRCLVSRKKMTRIQRKS